MEIQIEAKPAFRLIGKRWIVSTKEGANFRIIPGYWDQVMQDGTFKALHENARVDGLFHGAILGACFNTDPEKQLFDYMIAVESSIEKLQPEWESHRFEAGIYAIFKNEGSPLPKAIQSTFKYIYGEWFPEHPYQPGVGPEMEVYFEDDAFEIWVPVFPKDK